MKVFKIIQVNIYKGKYLEDLLEFLINENPDFISMQEVTSYGFNLYREKSLNLFYLIRKKLKMNGVFNGDLKLKDNERSLFGNAVFSKYKISESKVVILKTFRPVTLKELDGVDGEMRTQINRHLLDAVIDFDGQTIHVMSWHGAWTAPPKDTAETLRQAQIVASYLKNLDEPFILGCDANNVLESKTVRLINKVAKNWMIGSGAGQTTHPTYHKIVPRGFLVDYIFTSRHFKLKSLMVPQILVSDHLPVVAQLEI